MSGMWRNGDPAPRERLFFALMPDQREAFRISAWAEAGLGAGWNFVRADRQHMTLGITNDYERPPFELHEKLFRAGDMVAAAPVAVELDQLAVGGERAMLRPRHVNAPLKAFAACHRGGDGGDGRADACGLALCAAPDAWLCCAGDGWEGYPTAAPDKCLWLAGMRVRSGA